MRDTKPGAHQPDLHHAVEPPFAPTASQPFPASFAHSSWAALRPRLEAVTGVDVALATPRIASRWTLVARRGGGSVGTLDQLIRKLGPPTRWVRVPDGLLTWKGIAAAWEPGPAPIVGCGGGAVLDAAKLVSAIDRHGQVPASPDQLMRSESAGSVVAIPTTCGSGAELTPTVSLWDNDAKTSLDWPGLKPAIAVYEADFCAGAPPSVSVPAAWDALSHALESLWSRYATPESWQLAMIACGEMLGALASLQSNSPDWPRLQAGSAAAGGAISLTRSGLAHALSYPLTATSNCPHGLAAGLWSVALADVLLPSSDRAELAAILQIDPLPALRRAWRESGAAEMTAQYVSAAAISAALDGNLSQDRAARSLRTLHELGGADLASRACDLLEA